MMPDASSRGPWAERAATLYDEPYARHYRVRDEQLQRVASNQALIDWLGEVCQRFGTPIDVLDLGCGTGRYFWGLRQVKSLVGFDASHHMLTEARHPIHAERVTAGTISLVQGDLMTHEFPPAAFDLVYSIGVLAEHVPLDRRLFERVARWLRPGGRFGFTTVHPASPSVPRTVPRWLAERALPWLPEGLSQGLHRRLVAGGMYADQRWLRSQLPASLTIESLANLRTDVHLHALCVARKATA